MKMQSLLMPCALFLLGSALVQAAPTSIPAGAAPSAAIEARIARVEQGLSTRVVVNGSPDRKMELRQRMAFHQVPAVSIALVNNGRIEWARAYGMADAAGRRPATTDTLFQAASISKSLSAIGALRLVERGKLALDGAANRQLASWQIPSHEFAQAGDVSLRMLLNHSGGTNLHGYMGYMGYAQGQRLPTLLQVLDGLAPANSEPVRVDIAPGSLWRYSGGGYSLVQLMVSEASGQGFDRYMKAAVLDPLGMTRSTFTAPLPQRQRDRTASGHKGDGAAVAGRWPVYPESAAAGLWTTAGDLVQVLIEVQQAEAGKGRLLTRGMASTLLSRGLGEYGLGFFVEDLGDRTSFAHSGGTEGFRAQLYGYTRSGQGLGVKLGGQVFQVAPTKTSYPVPREHSQWGSSLSRCKPRWPVNARLKACQGPLANLWIAGMQRERPDPIQSFIGGIAQSGTRFAT